jgi:hypothetical protein
MGSQVPMNGNPHEVSGSWERNPKLTPVMQRTREKIVEDLVTCMKCERRDKKKKEKTGETLKHGLYLV